MWQNCLDDDSEVTTPSGKVCPPSAPEVLVHGKLETEDLGPSGVSVHPFARLLVIELSSHLISSIALSFQI